MIEINGAYGEGGGQIVRTACSLATLTRQACHIVNIRQARRVPGLRVQHLLAVQALSELCGGSLKGDQVGSAELEFHPGNAVIGDIPIRIGTAASITLIAQCLIPALLFASKPVQVAFSGGATDTAFAPPLDYFLYVFLSFMRRIGISVNTDVTRRGYYPRGGAELIIGVEPAKPKPLVATMRGALKEIRLISSAAAILKQRRVAERQVEGALHPLASAGFTPTTGVEYPQSFSAGSALCIVAEFEGTTIGTSALGARGKLAERVGLEAAEQFLAELDSTACLDSHMADQILPYMALAGGGGCVTVTKMTNHCRTNMWVIEQFLRGRFQVRGQAIRWIPREP